MNEEKAYEILQDMLALVEELIAFKDIILPTKNLSPKKRTVWESDLM